MTGAHVDRAVVERRLAHLLESLISRRTSWQRSVAL